MYNLTIAKDSVLSLSGKFDMGCAPTVRAEGRQMIGKLNDIKIDLSGVLQADSSILALLVDWIRFCRQQNKGVILINMPTKILDLSRVCSLDTILPIEKA